MEIPALKKTAIWGFLLFLVTSFFPPQPASAQASAACNAGYAGSNWMILECSPGFATAHDWIKIYSRAGFDSSQSWQGNLDTTNSIWIFEPASQSWASLIVDFHQEADGLVADLYDDGNWDDEVSYQLQGGVPVVTENAGHWSLRVIAKDGWWIHDDIVNYNLDLLVDSKMQAAFGDDGREYLSEAGVLKTDGQVDFQIHVRDLDRDGRPDYEWRQNRYPFPEDPRVVGIGRTQIIANTEDDELPPEEGVFWPYLSHKIGGYGKGRPGLPPIQVDWKTASIMQVAEFIRGRGEPGSYSIYSRERVQEGKTTTTDFETPFAFYDLANARDGYTDLNIRFGNLAPFANETLGVNVTPLNDIQYVWDQTHTQRWDYQVGLAGRQTIDEVIQFPEFSVRTVPYAKLPEWVTSQSWDAATFVQVENPDYNNEIVWGWSTAIGSDAVRREYLSGISDTPPVEDFSNPSYGLRGEYAFDYHSRPVLYFSPVDRKLHLLKAQAGTFRLDNRRTIQYQNLGGDYINQWIFLENGQPDKRIFFGSGYLLYGDTSSVKLTRSTVSPSVFTTLPPRNHAEWLKLGQTLLQNKPAFAPDDVNAMLAQFGEADGSITGASWRDLRLIKGGFRFILTLQKGFSVTGEDLLGIKDQASGDYEVTYDGSFHLLPFTPADIQLSFVPAQPAGDAPTNYMDNDQQVIVHNAGQEDVPQVQVSLFMEPPGQELEEMDPQTVTVLAGESRTVHLAWTPDSTGPWKLWARARWVDDSLTYHTSVTPEQVVQVQPAQQTSLEQELSAFGVIAPWQVLLLLGGLAMMAGLAGWTITQMLAREAQARQQPGEAQEGGRQ
jgi:hypothetical protein